jgi:nucleotide-binding universal stress UspA family protein
MSINHVLVPVRLDEHDASILQYACGLSVQGVKRLLIATAVESSGVEAPVIAAEVDRARERLVAMAAPLASCGMHVEVRVVTGDTTSAIVSLAHQSGIDVICLGTEGKSWVDYVMAGSVSEDLVTSGADRIMTVRYSLLGTVDDPASLARDFARRLVVTTDFSSSGTRAWLSAFDRPSAALGEVILLHVAASGEDRQRADVRLHGMLQIAEEHGVPARYEIREGEPAQTILSFLDEVNATGVITGKRGVGRLRKAILGSVSLQVPRDAPCPVVVQP